MKRIIKLSSAVALTVLLLAGAASADAIGKPGDYDSLYTDHRAYKVGDIVTVLVVENTEGYQKASLKTEKTQSMQGAMGVSSWGGGVMNPFPYVPSFGASGSEKQDGGGKSSRSGALMGKLSARVQKVLSNGNLVIKGTKVVTINDDKQNLVVKGVIRPQDIAANNTIYSTSVADAIIQYEGKGPIDEKTSPGIITRLLDWIGLF